MSISNYAALIVMEQQCLLLPAPGEWANAISQGFFGKPFPASLALRCRGGVRGGKAVEDLTAPEVSTAP